MKTVKADEAEKTKGTEKTQLRGRTGKMKGAEMIMECLLEEGVDTIFGYPGGAVIPLYDALYTYKKHFTHILTAHEQGATHAADGYARSTGKTGVVFATSGPGATNTVTGIATAYSDSVPMVVITGQVASPLLGRDSFQEVDITTITMTVTKHNFQVRRVEDLAETIKEAFQIAGGGRRGPVLVDVPKDLFMAETEYGRFKEGDLGKEDEEETSLARTLEQKGSFREKLLTAAKMINESKKPIIYSGGGVIASEAGQELQEFAEKGGIPVASSLMGLGGFSRNHPLSLGLVGMHGLKENNLALCHSDLVITIGARFSDRVTGQVNRFGAKAKMIQLDIDACEVGKNKKVDLSMIGSVKEILCELIPSIEKRDRGHWLKEIRGREEKLPVERWSGVQAIQTANGVFPDAVVVTDVGQHQMWTAQHWKFLKPGTFLSSGGLGTMGYGLGAAIGAKVGNRENPVVLVTGDGSFRMNMNELGTVAKYSLPIVILLLNNSSLGMVRQWQGLFCEERYSETALGDEVDFVRMAGAFGIEGRKVTGQKDLKAVLEDAKEQRKPMVIECVISKDEGVYPIVPPGVGISEMMYSRH